MAALRLLVRSVPRRAIAWRGFTSVRPVLVPAVVHRSMGLPRAPLQPRWARCYSTDLPDHEVIMMPALSPTMTTGTIASWNVKEGDQVAAGDSLAEIETDKASMSFDSPDDGVVAKILVPGGTANVALGKPILVMVQDSNDVAAFADFEPEGAKEQPEKKVPKKAEPARAAAPPASAASSSSSEVSSRPTASGNKVPASPLAKRLAREAQLALDKVTGSGPGGRVTKADVETAQAAMTSQPQQQPQPQPQTVPSGTFTDIPLTSIRKIIASRLLESKQNIPHYYLTTDVRVDSLLALRAEFNNAAEGMYKLSVNDFIIKASALAMAKVPAVNSSWMDSFIREHKHADICVAVSTAAGLITPIIPRAEQKGLVDISKAVKALAERARANKLAPHEFQGGTFTISNLGMFGVKNFSAIINPPQACILAVGASERMVVPDPSSDNGLGVATVMQVTLSCDHRVVDGAVGAEWLKVFKGFLEKPHTMLL